jgi:hypothetical protein
VESAGGLSSGCQSAAATANPSIALIDRKDNLALGNARMSSGSPTGGGAVSYSMLAAICVMVSEPPPRFGGWVH